MEQGAWTFKGNYNVRRAALTVTEQGPPVKEKLAWEQRSKGKEMKLLEFRSHTLRQQFPCVTCEIVLPSEKVSLILLTESYVRNEKQHHKSLPNTVSELCSSPFPPLSSKAGGARVLKRQNSGARVSYKRDSTRKK